MIYIKSPTLFDVSTLLYYNVLDILMTIHLCLLYTNDPITFLVNYVKAMLFYKCEICTKKCLAPFMHKC